ncbi:hypothetical protein BJ912DRAFT_71641 [Pholiota molesta]|nr:hypothetical protein BJ912DRAFT_71641 [Pholiota molesta]
MEAAQPSQSTRHGQRVNPLQTSDANSSNASPDGLMLPISEGHSADPPAQPPKKKAATSKPKLKRVKMLGKLSGLLALPLDIFFEITSHLHPLDLLHLSRASRHFARMFLRTDNRHAWLAARRTVEGLPDCPSDLSEAQYAHLLFESICSGCGKIGRRLLFNLRVRLCASCYKANVETYTMVEWVEDYRNAWLPFVPHNYSVTDPSVVEYFGHQLQDIMDEYDRMEAIGSEDDFLFEWHERVSALTRHGNLVNDFLEELRERKEQEKIQLRTTRKLQIDERIMALGYTRDEIPEDASEYEAEIMKPRALTERAWRGMSYTMAELAAARREEVFRDNLTARIHEWVWVYDRRYSCDGDWPDAANAGQADAVLELLSEANATIPFTDARFDAHSERILASVVAWSETAKQEIVDALAAGYGLPKDTALSRASAVIRCVECEELLFASRVIFHLQMCGAGRVLWDDRQWGYQTALHQIAKALLHHAGLACDVASEHVARLEGVLRCGCADMEAPRSFLELVAHISEAEWSCDGAFRLHKPGGWQVCYDGERHPAVYDHSSSKTEAVILLKMTLPTSSTSLQRSAEAPLKDDDPCCRLCAEACYMQVDMRSEDSAKQHMQVKHGKAEVLEADLCPARDVIRAAQEYAVPYGRHVILTRMGGR